MSGILKRKLGFHSLLSREASWQTMYVRISTAGYRLIAAASHRVEFGRVKNDLIAEWQVP